MGEGGVRGQRERGEKGKEGRGNAMVAVKQQCFLAYLVVEEDSGMGKAGEGGCTRLHGNCTPGEGLCKWSRSQGTCLLLTHTHPYVHMPKPSF